MNTHNQHDTNFSGSHLTAQTTISIESQGGTQRKISKKEIDKKWMESLL
jgi:hypothetical protein